MSAPRRQPTDTGPWCWQQKKARRLIRERMNGDSKTVYVLSVYDALTEIASDESTETFKTSHPYLAAKAGCGVSQLKLALEELVEAALILIVTPKLRGPCTFTLLAVPDDDAVSRTVANVSHDTTSDSRNVANVSHKPNSSAMATVEESSEEKQEEKKKKPGPLAIDVNAEAVRIGLTESDAKEFHHYYEARGWMLSGKHVVCWKALLESWKLKKPKFAEMSGAPEKPVYIRPQRIEPAKENLDGLRMPPPGWKPKPTKAGESSP